MWCEDFFSSLIAVKGSDAFETSAFPFECLLAQPVKTFAKDLYIYINVWKDLCINFERETLCKNLTHRWL